MNTCELLGDDAMCEDPLPLGHNDHVHHHVLREPDWGPEVPGQRHQQVEDADNVLGVD